MNIDTLVWMIIVLPLGNEYGTSLGIIKRNDIGTLNNTANVILMDMNIVTL